MYTQYNIYIEFRISYVQWADKKRQRSRVDILQKNSEILNAFKHVGKYRNVLL